MSLSQQPSSRYSEFTDANTSRTSPAAGLSRPASDLLLTSSLHPDAEPASTRRSEQGQQLAFLGRCRSRAGTWNRCSARTRSQSEPPGLGWLPGCTTRSRVWTRLVGWSPSSPAVGITSLYNVRWSLPGRHRGWEWQAKGRRNIHLGPHDV